MSAWIDRIVNSRTTHALQLSAQFTEARHRVLAENIANIDTPDYHTKRLDPEQFRASLRTAVQKSQMQRTNTLDLRPTAQTATTPDGRLHTTPATEPAPNILFHDGGNAMLEKLMTAAQSNALEHRLSLNLLRGRFESLLRAIRGRTS